MHFGDGAVRISIYSKGLIDLLHAVLSFQWEKLSNAISFVDRISNAGYFIERHPLIVAKYSSLEHDAPNEDTGW